MSMVKQTMLSHNRGYRSNRADIRVRRLKISVFLGLKLTFDGMEGDGYQSAYPKLLLAASKSK